MMQRRDTTTRSPSSASVVPTCLAASVSVVLVHTVHCTLASNLLNNDIDLVRVQKLLDHANVNNYAYGTLVSHAADSSGTVDSDV
jgi:site-specific recombinase XerD